MKNITFNRINIGIVMQDNTLNELENIALIGIVIKIIKSFLSKKVGIKVFFLNNKFEKKKPYDSKTLILIPILKAVYLLAKNKVQKDALLTVSSSSLIFFRVQISLKLLYTNNLTIENEFKLNKNSGTVNKKESNSFFSFLIFLNTIL